MASVSSLESGEVKPQVVGIATQSRREVYMESQQQQQQQQQQPSLSTPHCRRPSGGLQQVAAPAGSCEGHGHAEAYAGEEEVFLEQEALSPQESRCAIALVLLSGFDMLGSAVLAGLSFKYAYRDEGVSLYCLGIQGISHLLSSVVLVTRFMWELLPPRDDDSIVSDGCLLREQRRRDLQREQALAVFMGLTMLLSCAALLFKAFRKIKFWDVWYLDHDGQDREIEKVTDLMAWWGFGGYTVQALFRFFIARRLRRSIVWHTFTVSAVTLVFFLALGLAASYEREWSWKAEPVCAMCLVVVMLCEAIRMVILHLGDVEYTLRMDSRA